MSVKLLELVMDHPHLHRSLKSTLAVLAFRAHNDDGTGIFAGTCKLARWLGVRHRQAVTKILREPMQLGMLITVRPGGHRRGSQRGNATYRALVVWKIAALGRSPAETMHVLKKYASETGSHLDSLLAGYEANWIPDRGESGSHLDSYKDSKSYKRKTVPKRERPTVKVTTLADASPVDPGHPDVLIPLEPEQPAKKEPK
jgi:hypothetical protein